MPIRMVDDQNDNYTNENENTGGGGGRNPGGGGGGGMLMQFLPMLLGLFMKKPKLLLLVAVIGGIYMFTKGGCGSMVSNAGGEQNSAYKTGGKLDPEEYKKAQVYEGLDESKNTLPEYVSLLNYAPDRRNQGSQGSCVAWSSAYAARTILQSASAGDNPNEVAFSPAFMYNQIGLEGCQGSYIIRAMENLTRVGAVKYNDFKYTDQDCSRQPDGSLMNDAQRYKMLGFTRLSGEAGTDALDIHAIKEHLAKDVPVIIGMMVGGTFMQGMMGKSVWQPTDEDYNQMGFGGHAMCVIGYDDRREGGVFEIMNSWGPEWGNNGVGFVKYKDFKHFTREAYGLNPMPKSGSAIATELSCQFGLVNESKQYIPLKYKNGNVFTTTAPIAKMSKFKVEVKNNAACYIYVIGKETDGSSYVLFPYPNPSNPSQTMFSPYCGITGYRLFPKGKSMQADAVGNQDYVAVITSNDELNIFNINQAISQNRNMGFENAVNAALQNVGLSNNVRFGASNDGTFGFNTPTPNKTAVAMILEINKQ